MSIQNSIGLVTLMNLLDQGIMKSLGREFAVAELEKDMDGNVCLSSERTLGVPARVACQQVGASTRFFVAHTIREIAEAWEKDVPAGIRIKPFHPSYTEMWTAGHKITVPANNPRARQYEWRMSDPAYRPKASLLPADIHEVGKAFADATVGACRDHLADIPDHEAIGVSLSGGMDSSGVLALLLFTLESLGRSNTVHAFTLAVDGGGSDLAQARIVANILRSRFPGRVAFHEILADSSAIDREALLVEVANIIEDYRPLDLGAALAGTVLFRAIAERQKRGEIPLIRHAFDGDGGNEVFRDYPLAHWSHRSIRMDELWENPYLFLLGDDRRKLGFNPVYSAGISRGYVRTFATARHFGVIPHSPLIDRRVVEMCAQMPLKELAPNEEALHRIRGLAVQSGIETIANLRLPLFQKSYFQEGCSGRTEFLTVTAEESRELKKLILG